MRNSNLILGGLLAAGAAASVAMAQSSSSTVLNVKATVSPSKAGTKQHPRGVKLTVKTTWTTSGDQNKPVIQRAVVLFPKDSLYNGAKYPKCSQTVLARRGPNACPKGSIMGTGTGSAFADTVLTHPHITVVNGGATRVFLYTVLDNPARVQAPVPGVITKMSGKWAYKLELTVPQNLQIVAGVPIALRDLTFKVGRKDWLATTGCPSGTWPFSVQTFYDNGQSSTFEDAVRCTK
jgi:hypothetical protein